MYKRLAVTLFGLFLLLLGLGFLGAYLILPFLYRGINLLEVSLALASLAALPLGFGLALTYQGLGALLGHPSRRFLPPPARLMALGFLLALASGEIVLLFCPPRLASFLFPPLHILASALPAGAVVAFVGRRMASDSTWRAITLQASHGALLSPFLAFGLELFTLLFLLGAVLLFRPDRGAGLDWLEDPVSLSRLILSPPVLMAGGVIFVIVAPFLEEFIKSLGVPLLGLQKRGDAFLWGVTCGAGFSALEGLINGGVALEGWWLVMLFRWGATLMHALASGLMGLGWYGFLARRRPWQLLGAYGASVGVHALWNSAAMALIALSSLALISLEDPLALVGVGMGALVTLLFMLVLTVAMSWCLLYLARR
ncbi:MAG TPA: hypothetical protein DCP08_03090 [Chloroflexi bacterium]|nr:hypothetical protein [Chloroflexota bacterium]